MKAAPLFEYDAGEEPVSGYRHYLSWLLTKIWSAKQNKTNAWEVPLCFFEHPTASHCPHAGANSPQVGIRKDVASKAASPPAPRHQPTNLYEEVVAGRKKPAFLSTGQVHIILHSKRSQEWWIPSKYPCTGIILSIRKSHVDLQLQLPHQPARLPTRRPTRPSANTQTKQAVC